MRRHISAFRAGLTLLREDGPMRFYNEGKMYMRKSILRTIHSLNGEIKKGESVFNREWDMMIILDACRVDAIEEISGEYEFIDDIDTLWSLGSTSKEWMERNFTEENIDEMSNTTHITGNPFSEDILDKEEWAHLEEVWKSSWDQELGTIHPRALTDKAISLSRRYEPENMIVHYMQPHTPFVGFEESGQHDLDRWGEKGDIVKSEWGKLRDGDLDFETVWNGYLDNLRYVLDDIEILLNNIDAENTVITADHGECVGEYGLYGHPEKIAIDALREVPWITTSATDKNRYSPSDLEDTVSVSKEEQLQALGYR